MTKYKKITIDHDIYIKVFHDGTVSYLMVYTDNFLNTTNAETSFTELRIFFEEYFELKVQEGSVLRYRNFRIFHSPLGFSIDKNDHITEIVNEWLPTGKFKKFDLPFRTDSTYEK